MESKRVAKPADIFVVAQSQMRGVWIQVPTLCMSVPCTCSAATDFKSTISSVKSSQRFAACLGITLGGLGLITQLGHALGDLLGLFSRNRRTEHGENRRRVNWLWVNWLWIPFWDRCTSAPPILEPILVGIGMFTGGTGF